MQDEIRIRNGGPEFLIAAQRGVLRNFIHASWGL